MGCCSVDSDFIRDRISYDEYHESDLVEFVEIDGHILKYKYYYDYRTDRILRLVTKNGKQYYIHNGVHENKRTFDINGKYTVMLTSDKGQNLLYDYHLLKNRLKQLYHDSIKNKLREEVNREFSSSEPLLHI